MRVLPVNEGAVESDDCECKWQGSISASIAGPLKRAWEIGSDFCGLHKFVPIIEVCERLKGRNNVPGCLRFYTLDSSSGLPGGKRKGWVRDRLVAMDPDNYCFTYALEGSNLNLEDCIFTFHLEPDGKDNEHTLVTWSFELNPGKKSTKEKTLNDICELGYIIMKGLEAEASQAG